MLKDRAKDAEQFFNMYCRLSAGQIIDLFDYIEELEKKLEEQNVNNGTDNVRTHRDDSQN